MSKENYLICFLCCIFQLMCAALSLIKIGTIENKGQVKTKIVIIILTFCYCLASFFIIPNELRSIVSLLYAIFVFWKLFNIKSFEAIIRAIIFEILFIISEIIGSLIILILGYNSQSIVLNPKSNLLANIAIAVILIILISIPLTVKLIKQLIIKYRKNKKTGNKLILFCLIFFLLSYKNGFEFLLKSNYYLNSIFMILVIIIVLSLFKNEYKSEKLKEQNLQMLNYVTKYEKIITDQGKANHEFKNQLMVIKGYANTSKEKLIEYINSITEDVKKTSSSYLISQLNNFPDGGIKGLLYYKLSMMEDEKIKYDLSVCKAVKNKLKRIDTQNIKNITKILGILLDNAIEAAKASDKKEIQIYVDCEKECVTFEISNTYKGKIYIDKIGTGYTTKGKGHGYGLKVLKDIIEENNIYNVEKEISNKFYITKFIVKTEPNKKGN